MMLNMILVDDLDAWMTIGKKIIMKTTTIIISVILRVMVTGKRGYYSLMIYP